MKLKLLLFMGLLTVFCNTVYGQLPNPNLPPAFTTLPASRIECPKYVAANTTFSVTDSNTPAPLLIVTAAASGAQSVELSTIRQDVTGLLRAIDVTPIAPFVGGIVTVTLTLTDVAPPGTPISVTTTFTVNFNDSTPPSISPLTLTDRDVDLDATAGCNFTVPDYTGLIAANDTCGDVTVTQSPTAGTVLTSLSHNGTQVVTLTATDEYTNATSISFTITFKDVTDPTISTVADRDENLDASCDFVIPDYTSLVTTSDNCGTVTVTQSPIATTLSNHNTTQVITLTADDGNGNTTDTTFTITLKDVTAPVFTVTPTGGNVNLDANCEFTVPDYVALSTATDNCGTANITQSPTIGSVLTDGDDFVQTITLTANDGNGNTTDTTFTITLQDVTNPVITSVLDKDVDLNVDCEFLIPDYTGEATATDNCGTTTITQSPAIGTLMSGHNDSELITLTADDGNGNTAITTFTVTAKDVTDPTIANIDDVEVGTDPGVCQATLATTPAATFNDNCTVASSSGVRSDALALGAPYPKGDTTITWTVTDGAGNVTSETQTITVNDDEDPVISSPMVGGFNALITVDNDPGQCTFATAQLLSNPLIAPTATDNCPVALIVVSVSPEFVNVSAGPDHPTELITWTVTDDNGNTATATQEILVRDLVLPVMRTKDISKTFDANGQVVVTVDDIDDGSTDNSGTACFTKYVVDNIIDCNEVGVHDVVLFGKDAWGNQHYSIAKVTTVDDTPPAFVEANLPIIDLNTNTGCTWVGVLPIPATTDNCSVVSVTNDAPAAFPVGDTTVTWTVSDAANNTTTLTQLVSIVDAEKPVAIAKLGVVVELDNAGEAILTSAEIDNGSSDNCSIDSIVVSPDVFDCASVGSQVVTLTVTDVNGNVSTIDTVITVVDNIAPVLVTKDFTATLSATGTVSITDADVVVSATDACTIKSTIVSPNTFTCANIGDNTVTITVTDANNNVTTGTAIVTVEDDIDPTITVTDIEVDANSGCVWTGTLGTPVTADNCAIISVTSDKAIDFAYPVGDTNVVWTVTDAAGNTATATQVVTVKDTEKPIALASDFTVKLDASGVALITVADVNNGSSDNCGIKAVGGLTISKSSFDCTNVGKNTVVLTVTDNSDNVSTANAIVTVVDDILPVIATVSAITANTDSGCAANINIVAPSATDNCTNGTAVGTRSDAKLLTDVYPLGRTIITWNFSDASGNAAVSVIQTVDVSDDDKPTITTTPIVVDTNSGCVWTGTLGMPVTTDNCSVASVTNDKTADFAYPVGVTTVTWTVTDAAGNTATAIQTVTVRDTESPIAKASDITIKLSAVVGAGAASITVADVNNGSSDNCGIKAVGGLTISKSSFDCTNVGKNTVVLTVTDNSDNVSTANAIVTVVDDILPVIAPVSAINVNTSAGICGANLATTPSATATDNCSVGTPIGTRSDARALSATYPLGRTTITWNVKDVNGNVALSVIQTVDVTDAQAPVITTNGNKTANADLGGCSAVVTVSATAADNCGVGSPVGVRSDALPLSSPYPVGVTTITWNVTDVNGNAAVAVIQTVTVSDTQRPVITANGNKNLVSDFGQCGANVVVSATATDNCSVIAPVVGTRSDLAAINALYPVGTTTITWNVTDVNGNAATPVVQTVIVRDLQVPVINGTVVSIDANTDANACGATVTVTPPTASDNCSVGAPVGTRSDNLALTALYPIGTTTITWRVTDLNGNIAVPTTTTVKVKDMVLPTAITKNIAVQLNVGGFATIVPADVNNGSTDNCGIASYSLDKISFNCSNIGANTVTLTVIDIHGNVNSNTAIVTISEPIKPIARTRNITVQLNALGTVTILPSDINNGSTDNCAIVSYNLSKSTFDCTNVGQNIINLTATDASGNVSDPAPATVIVQDLVAPVVVTQTYTAFLNAAGTVTITAADVNNGSTDACGIKLYAISKETFTCANVGENVITLTVTDNNSNVGQAFVKVNVVDNIAPEVVTRNIDLRLEGNSVSITPEDVLVSATDACGVDVHSYRLSQDTFTIADVLASPVTIRVYATDVNGNEGYSEAIVTFPRDPVVANEVITPNGDPDNEYWVIDNIQNFPNSVVKVYNTWGSLVFSKTNYQNDWNGKINGNDVTLPDGGSYYYQIDFDGNGSVDEQGWLYITRQ